MVKRVLVTGGATRLGAECCRQFALADWEVVCHYNNSEQAANTLLEELSALGAVAHLIRADLVDYAARNDMLKDIFLNLGPIHCLVNNASEFVADYADDFDIETATRQLNVNLLAPLALSAELAKQWKIRPSQCDVHDISIIHILDQKVFNLNPDYFSYTISKLALERSVALQAQALAPKIRVCGIAPGLLYLSGPQTKENFSAVASKNLLQRPIQPSLVAKACVFLAQNQCVTGSVLSVDNGQHLVASPRDVMFMTEDNL